VPSISAAFGLSCARLLSINMITVVLWLLGSSLVAAIARQKGQSTVGFFALALVLSPLIGLIVVAVVRKPLPRSSV
jgi:hypothetical protein